jgi:hypothetical protein
MLTDRGENAEAYFSFDGSRIIFQATTAPGRCDQIFAMPAAGGEPRLVSTGSGRTTCAYFLPRATKESSLSTHLGADCHQTPTTAAVTWPIYSVTTSSRERRRLGRCAPHRRPGLRRRGHRVTTR